MKNLMFIYIKAFVRMYFVKINGGCGEVISGGPPPPPPLLIIYN